MSEYQDAVAISKAEMEKVMLEDTIFIIEKKDGTKIGHINGFMRGIMMEIGFAVVPSERRRGCGTEAIQLMVDYIFLTRGVVGIQASTETRNMPAQKVLVEAGFMKEGTMQKSSYVRGEYRGQHLYSILREGWKEPKILQRNQMI